MIRTLVLLAACFAILFLALSFLNMHLQAHPWSALPITLIFG